MENVKKTVFLSYRRTNIPWALNLFQNLTHNGYDVFFDYSGIASGDFERIILENIVTRDHFLVLLTPSALESCGDPSDWLRREIETALNSRRNIVPLMLDGFNFDNPKIASQLTGSLAALRRYNGLNIPADYFMEAMKRLRNKFLAIPLASVSHPASLPAQQAAAEQQLAAAAAPPFRKEELTAQQWVERGLAAIHIDEQVRFYTEALRLNPDYPEAFVNRANARRTQGDLEGALRDYSAAIGLKNDYAVAFYNRANTRRAQGDLERALQDYSEAIRLSPDYVEAMVNRANARRAQGDLESALQDYNDAIRLRPDDAVALNNRASARRASGDLEGALRDYDEAIRLKPNYAEAFHNRANAHRAANNAEKALSDEIEALRLGYKPI